MNANWMTYLARSEGEPLRPPAFVISLDFELHWGMSDVVTTPEHPYMRQLLGARRAVPAILDLFRERHIRATWATVGYLFAEDRETLTRFSPVRRPRYSNPARDNYRLEIGDDEASDPLHYARSLVDLIAQTPGQEVASHTFSHYYCHEEGQTPEDFKADLAAAMAIAEHAGHRPSSLVLPRNQVDEAYLAPMREAGFRCYRGNPQRAGFSRHQRGATFRRALRLLDSYVDLTGHHGIKWHELKGDPLDIPASMFLRPRRGVPQLDALRLRRIKNAMRSAARRGEIFHLWWHPHNFGGDTDANLRDLATIIGYFQSLSIEYGMRSMSMGDVLMRHEQATTASSTT
ncbi:polysaccharide deacetylase family protein [Chromohalobacter canadensis]|uniref:polysaccharide deacetylase family protein n=1 Tax=Chromohalobacter canadensis TaxID=141389 RepID=UPI0021C18BCB|nr:polysaccharide deacetylase family protein [Chromohalobacter canadensis]MCT8468089.1 polysaccharide deacetylase family protein [Chromohalobacter canadensis]